MRTALLVLALVAVALPAHGRKPARPKPVPITGHYAVRFKQVANSCATAGIALGEGTIDVTQTGTKLEVSIPITAIMRGSVDDRGKFRARAKRGGTAIQGVQGEFSVAGSVVEGKLELTLVAQYFSDGKPLCQQTWNARGKRS